MAKANLIDPVKFCSWCWPDVRLYDKQKEILYSVRDNDETLVPAGHQLGKDFITALAVLWWFCSRRPSRVVTTSVKYDQLNDVLWGEIRRFLNTSRVKLPIKYNHMHIRQVKNDGTYADLTELVGQVANKDEALFGRHLPRDIPRTLVAFDEASGIDDAVYNSCDTWAHHKLIIGNPYPCENFFKKGVTEGNLLAPDGSRYYRNVIKIKAEDSPNVKLAEAEIRGGKEITNRILIPGVIDYQLYQKRRATWDPMRQTIGLDAEFYEGAEVKMFPPDWLKRAFRLAKLLKEYRIPRIAKTIGVDPAEGGDRTCWSVCDDYGLIFQLSMRTPDTTVITSQTLALMREYNVQPQNVLFDKGGGGKEHADRLRFQGFPVRAVGFGEAAMTIDRFKKMKTVAERKEDMEERYVYKNRRAEMYGLTRLAMDPTQYRGLGLTEDDPIGPPFKGFSIPEEYGECVRQLKVLPLMYDGEGRIMLPPKNKPPTNPDSKIVTLVEMLGCSPDEADSLVLGNFAIVKKPTRTIAGAVR